MLGACRPIGGTCIRVRPTGNYKHLVHHVSAKPRKENLRHVLFVFFVIGAMLTGKTVCMEQELLVLHLAQCVAKAE